MDPQLVIVRDDDPVGGCSPRGHLLRRHAELTRLVLVALAYANGAAQVSSSHEVRVDVVVGDGAVLVGPGDAVDTKIAANVIVPEGPPEARRLHENVGPRIALEDNVA